MKFFLAKEKSIAVLISPYVSVKFVVFMFPTYTPVYINILNMFYNYIVYYESRVLQNVLYVRDARSIETKTSGINDIVFPLFD